jgi:hypothetical protein
MASGGGGAVGGGGWGSDPWGGSRHPARGRGAALLGEDVGGVPATMAAIHGDKEWGPRRRRRGARGGRRGTTGKWRGGRRGDDARCEILAA